SFANGVPSADDWRIVSSKRMTPLMYSSTPAVVKRRSRYARRFASVDSTRIESKRFAIVPSDSSAARIPFPSATSAFAVWCRSFMLSSVALTAEVSLKIMRPEGPCCGGGPSQAAFVPYVRRRLALGEPQRALLRVPSLMSSRFRRLVFLVHPEGGLCWQP